MNEGGALTTCTAMHDRSLKTIGRRILTTPGWNGCFYDSPLKNQQYFFNERFTAARHKEKIPLKKKYAYILLCVKVCRWMTSGCRGTPHFGRYNRELVLKPAISLKKNWGGYRRTTRNTPCFRVFIDEADGGGLADDQS